MTGEIHIISALGNLTFDKAGNFWRSFVSKQAVTSCHCVEQQQLCHENRHKTVEAPASDHQL